MLFFRSKISVFVTALFMWVSLYSFSSYYTPYLSGLSISSSFIGIIAGSFGMVSLLIKLPLGIIADTYKRYKVFVCCGLLLSFVSGIIMLSSTSAILLLVARILNGFTASTWIIYFTLYAGENSDQGVSRLQSTQFFGQFCGVVVSGMVFMRYGIYGTFYMSIVSAGVALLFSLFLDDSRVSREPLNAKGLLLIVRDRNMLICALLATLYQFCSFATAYNFTQSLAKDIGALGLQLSLVSAVRLIFASVSCRIVLLPLFSKRSDRFNLLIGFGTMAVYCFLLPLCNTIAQVYLLSAVGGMSCGFALSYLTSKCLDTVPSNERTVGIGFFQCAFSVGVTLGPMAMGYILDHSTGYLSAFFTMGVLSVVAGVLSAILMPRRRRL